MSAHTQLARDTICQYLSRKELPETKNLPGELLNKKTGCFVSLHDKNGELRGCIGTILPVYKNLAGEIIHNAVEAAFHDPRFQPVTEEEIDKLEISVDVLSEPEPIPSEKSLNPKKYGVIVKANDGRTGLLLPDLEDINDAAYQVAIARQKAGILPEEPVFLYRFTVTRYKE
jgi:AmmeMemoRadiSam system protein A